HRIGSTFAQLARSINPVVTGWMRYYGAFYPSAMHPLLTRINSLPGALDPLQISAAETGEESPSRLQKRGPEIPCHVPTLAVDTACLANRMKRAG
ncbi:group II intron maturase-specific domain-containing protein, partial [Nocardia sp. CWNU-33]|uniref:group II intron maturase-specific domain-containing protein n=1 Tax=Nocardia sp. CWNU-33 TaxID=3392117 RepID=UPI00398F4245